MEEPLRGSVSDIVVNDERNAIYAYVTFENSSIKLYVCISRPTFALDIFRLFIVDDNNPTFSYQDRYNLRKGWEFNTEIPQEFYVKFIYTIKCKVFHSLLDILIEK